MATDSFLHRWSKRKQAEQSPDSDQSINEEISIEQADQALAENVAPAPDTPVEEADENTPPPPTMEDVERLKEGDSAAAFFAKGVEASVKKAALRKLFRSEAYNIRDGMNDYDFDYTKTGNLASEVAESLRKWTKEKLETGDETATEPTAPEQELASDQPLNDDEPSQAPEDETKSTHENRGDNLSYPVGQNVPMKSKDKNSSGS